MSIESNDQNKTSFTLDFGSGTPFNASVVSKDTIEDDNVADEHDNNHVEETEEVDNQTEESTEEVTEVAEATPNDTSEEVDETPTQAVIENDSEESEEEDNTGFYYHVGQDLKADGFLPEDIELPEDVDGLTVYDAYKSKLRNDLEPIVRNEHEQRLINEGYGKQDLLIARAFRQGVDPRLLSEASMYEMYATMKDDAAESDKETIIGQMYRTRGFNETEIENQIAISKDKETLDNLYKESKEFFGAKYQQFVVQEEQRNSNRARLNAENEKKANDLIDNVIKSRSIKDLTMTNAQAKEFEEGIRKQNVMLDVEGGQKMRISEIQKFLYDFENDDEVKLLAFYLHKFRDQQVSQIKKDAKKQAESDFLKGYKQKVIKKNQKVTKKQNVKKQLKESKGNSNRYFVGF